MKFLDPPVVQRVKITICGPAKSGKSALAVLIARALRQEDISVSCSEVDHGRDVARVFECIRTEVEIVEISEKVGL